MRDGADIVIVGGGIMGLSVAYNLAKQHGKRSILVVERSYLCGGASGRNGGGLRAQWSSELNVRLMQQSLQLCREFAREHHINTWFRQGGYLFVARSPEQASSLAASVDVQRRHGLKTELVAPRRITSIVAELDPSGVDLASYNPDDAVVFPWPFVWGYAEGARRLGVEIQTFCSVTDIERSRERIEAVVTDRGRVRTSCVVNAAGAFSPKIAAMVGLELPTHPHRHEICSSEPLKPWLTPLVADLSNGLYFSQSTRGEIVGGVGDERGVASDSHESSARFLALYARALLRLCPRLGHVKVLRQWAGLYDISPDRNPIVGSVDEVPGLYLTSGFVGHGFMMAPVIGRLLAEAIATGRTPEPLETWNLRRFKTGQLLDEGMIIG